MLGKTQLFYCTKREKNINIGKTTWDVLLAYSFPKDYWWFDELLSQPRKLESSMCEIFQ